MEPTLKQRKQKLKNLFAAGIDVVLKTLKQDLPETSVRYNELVILEARYREHHGKMMRGVISNDEAILETNKIREAILTFIDSLEEKDFQEGAQQVNKKGHRTGKILYRIPQKMQVQTATKCLVRIAFDEETLLYDIEVQVGDEIKELRRVSDVMRVELIDGAAEKAFDIRTFSDATQFVDEDDYTEWQFTVTPLRPGEFPIVLKVSVIEIRNDRERKRDIVLEERVQIVTEPVAEDGEETAFKQAKETLQTAQPHTTGDAPAPAAPNKKKKKKKKGKKKSKGGVKALVYSLALMLFASAAWAVPGVREEVRWINTSIVQNDKEAYQKYKEQYPESRRMAKIEHKIEDFEWQEVEKAPVAQKEKELQDYQLKYANGRYTKQANEQLADIEYKRLPLQAPALELEQIIAKYPETKAAEIAKTRLKGLDPLQAPQDNTPQQIVQNEEQPEEKQAPPQQQAKPQTIQLTDTEAWQRVQADNTVEAYKNYISNYPDGIHVETARQRIAAHTTTNEERTTKEENVWTEVQNANTKEAFEKYLQNYPNGKYLQKAKDQIIKIETAAKLKAQQIAEENAWKEVQKLNTKEAYEKYRKEYPTGKYIDKANDNIKQLTKTTNEERSTKNTPTIKDLEANMVRVTGGTFTMGCTSEQGNDCEDDEKPAHKVTVSSFSISKYEVTQKQWHEVMGDNPSYNKGCDNCPVERVSWDDIQEFLKKLNAMTGKKYRLPTEAEWEYAARGGNKSKGYKYAGSNTLDDVAWYRGNSHSKTHSVGQKKPNELGLYDMSGNVWEWCQDIYQANYKGAPTNGVAWVKGGDQSFRVLRGGSWSNSDDYCRVAYRGRNDAVNRGGIDGFRLVGD